MRNHLGRISSLALWWLLYVPLNSLILAVFLKHMASARRRPVTDLRRPDDDSGRIKEWADAGLAGKIPANADEGIGTMFERRMMARLLAGLASRHGLESVLESPADGVTGVPGANSLPMARVLPGKVVLSSPSKKLLDAARKTWSSLGLENGLRTVEAPVSRLPFEDGAFDLVWSFCMLERLTDPVGYLREMARVSGRMVLMVTLNERNHGTRFHRAYHRALGREWDHGDPGMMNLPGIVRAFQRAGMEVASTGAVDVPPTWDTWDMPLGSEVWRLAAQLGCRQGKRPTPPKRDEGKLLAVFGWMEDNLPTFFKAQHAHHLYVLGQTGGKSGARSR